MRVVALRLVLDPPGLDLQAPITDPNVALDGHVDTLSRPHVLAVLGGTDDLHPATGAEAQEATDLAGLRMPGLDPHDRSLVRGVEEETVAVASFGPDVAARARHQ
jgi:hypothetical protein